MQWKGVTLVSVPVWKGLLDGFGLVNAAFFFYIAAAAVPDKGALHWLAILFLCIYMFEDFVFCVVPGVCNCYRCPACKIGWLNQEEAERLCR